MAGPVSKKRRATVEDFLAIPEEERFHELLDGEVVEKAVPSAEHGDAQVAVSGLLFLPFGRGRRGGHPGGWWLASEVEIKLGGDICRPDVVGWRRERVPERPRGKLIAVTPDWTCEILSDSHKRNDIVRKKRIYHRNRVGHYWIVDPELETLTVYRWHEAAYPEIVVAERHETVRAEPFDAIEIPVGILFGDLPDE